MSEKQKRDLLIGIITAAMLPSEIESQLIAYVRAKCPDEAFVNNFMTGAECMRHMAIHKIMELEEGCLGIQKAAFVVARNAIEDLEIMGGAG